MWQRFSAFQTAFGQRSRRRRIIFDWEKHLRCRNLFGILPRKPANNSANLDLLLWVQYIANASSSLYDQLHFFWLMRKTKTKTETETETETETRYQGKKEKQSSSSGRSKLDPRLSLAAYCHHLLVKMFVIITPPNIHYVPPKVDNHPPILKPAPKSRPKKLMIWWRKRWSNCSEKISLEFIQELGLRVSHIIIIWSSIDAICPFISLNQNIVTRSQ